MSGLKVKNPVYPIIGIAAGVVILVTGLVTADKITSLYYLAAVWLLFLCFGYYRSCLAVIPFALVSGAVFCAITYAVSKSVTSTVAAANRILAVCVAVLPGLGLSPVLLVRNLSQLRAPRMVTLGMMIALSFFPLLKREVSRVREAMKTRGAGSVLNPKIFYRAFLIPLTVRLVNISDTLALSVETRGFCANDKNYTVYREVKLQIKDIVFAVLLAAGSVTAVIL